MARLIDNHPGLMPDEFKVAVALGQVPKWETYRKFGMNNDVPASGS